MPPPATVPGWSKRFDDEGVRNVNLITQKRGAPLDSGTGTLRSEGLGGRVEARVVHDFGHVPASVRGFDQVQVAKVVDDPRRFISLEGVVVVQSVFGQDGGPHVGHGRPRRGGSQSGEEQRENEAFHWVGLLS